MRRAATTTLATVGLALAIAGTALALSYKTGTYAAGNPATGAGVQLTQHGHFSGTYRSSAGVASVSGHIHGGRLTVSGTEHGPYNPGSTATPNLCRGSHTFHATLRAG